MASKSGKRGKTSKSPKFSHNQMIENNKQKKPKLVTNTFESLGELFDKAKRGNEND